MQPRYLEQIEKVMSLLAFVNTKECMSYELTTAQYRSKIADSMNEVLLGEDRRGQALNTLLNLGKWCAKRL